MMEDFDGDREEARRRFMEAAFIAARAMPAKDLNFFALRLLFQVDPRDMSGLQAEMRASLEAERQKTRLEVVRKEQR